MHPRNPLLTPSSPLWNAQWAAGLTWFEGSQKLAQHNWSAVQRWAHQTGQIGLETLNRSSAAFAEHALAAAPRDPSPPNVAIAASTNPIGAFNPLEWSPQFVHWMRTANDAFNVFRGQGSSISN